MAMTAEQRTARARKAALTRHHPDKTPDEARREITDRAIEAAVAQWPPLTAEQRQRLAVLLHPGSASEQG